MVVVTERLGRPRRGSGDFIQLKLVYPVDSGTPTATCHVLPAVERPTYCGYPWEALVEVPGASSLEDVPAELRCAECAEAAGG